MKKQIIYVRDHRPRPSGRPIGAPMPTWYDRNDGNLRAMNAAYKEAAKARAERFKPPKNLPIIREKKSWWPF